MRALHYVAIAIVMAALAPATSHAYFIYHSSGPGAVYLENPVLPAVYNRVLVGKTQVFEFDTTSTIQFRAHIDMPDTPKAKKDIAVALTHSQADEKPIAVATADTATWGAFSPAYATTTSYLEGQSLDTSLPPGHYELLVWSSNNDSEYALTIGDLANQEITTPTSTQASTSQPLSTRNIILILVVLLACIYLFWHTKEKGSEIKR